MSLELILEIGALGPFRVGAPIESVLRDAAAPAERFQRGPETFYALYDSNLQVGVDESGTVQFVEAFEPIRVMLEGEPLIGQRLKQAESRFRQWGLHRVLGSDGFVCLARSCTVAARGGKVSSVAVFRSGYYDGLPLEAI